MDLTPLSKQDFLTNGNIGVRLYGDAEYCVVIERQTGHSPWREVGETFTLPMPEGFDVPVLVAGPVGKLNLAVTMFEIDHPEQHLRSLLVGRKTANAGAS